MGLAAAYYAAKENLDVLVLEQFDFMNRQGASGGDSRQFRIQYNEREISQLVLDSVPLWNELQSHTDEVLLQKADCVWFGDPNVTGAEGQINTVVEVMRELKLPFRNVNKAEIEAQYHFSNLPDAYSGFVQPDGAAINYPATLRTLLRNAREFGRVELKEQQKVTAIISELGGVQVRTATDNFSGSKLIIAPGPYVNEVLALLGIQMDIVIWEMISAYFRKTDPDIDYPTWINFDDAKGDDPFLYYGFPELDWGNQGKLVKVAANYPTYLHRDLKSYTMQPDATTVQRIANWVRRFMPGLDPQPLFPSSCVCALVPQPGNPLTLRRELVLDFAPENVPHRENIVIYATGWAAKIIPLIGKICVDLTLRKTTSYDIEKLRFTPDLLG